ncbi:MAG TPA: VOC family protein [Microlunatus sp.]
MASRIRTITVDCVDHERLGRFWAAAADYVEDPDNPNQPGDPEWLLVPAGRIGPALLFIPVPEPKSSKNRLHLDLQPIDRTQDEEIDRLIGLGATMIDDRRALAEDGGWAVLADPEGHEFCVEPSEAERRARAEIPAQTGNSTRS